MKTLSLEQRIADCGKWPERLPEEQWRIYKDVMAAARERNVRFAVGGGLAAMTYAGQWRNTKDIDLYVLPQDVGRMIQIVKDLGLADYYEVDPYDRKWIYRSHRDDTIVDIMWAMANQRAQVDERWLEGPEVEAGGERFRLLAPEEEIWSKLYVLQRDRCDWMDTLNLIYGVGTELNWRHLIARAGDDVPLLRAVVSIFAWVAPDRARQLPGWLWPELGVKAPQADGGFELTRERARLLDSRPWFTPLLEENSEGATKC